MKVDEALKYLKDANRNNNMICILPNSDIGKCIIKALDEIQMYNNGNLFLVPSNVFEKLCKENDTYKEIGTPEECREALEKQIAKKPVDQDEEYSTFKCPICGGLIFTEDRFETHKHCLFCGQKLDWSDED